MIISGRNSINEALKANQTLNKILISKSSGGFEKTISMAKEKGIRLEFVDRVVLDKLSKNNQGIVAYTTDFNYSELDELIVDGDCLLVVLDEIEDPHNFGAIIRSCECAGVNGIIIPNRRATPVTDTVVKTSAGAISNVKIAKVINLNQAIEKLKQNNIWVYGLEAGGKEIYSVNLRGRVAIVVGSEGRGISKLTKEKCDEIISLPLMGKINSLNASVACGIALYEVVRQNR